MMSDISYGYDSFKFLKVSPEELAKATPTDKLILENIALVGHIVGKFATLANVARDDIFQAGLEGLIRAAQLFKPSRNIRFSTYAYVAIQHSIWNLLDTTTYPVKVTYRIAKKVAEISKYVEEFHGEHTGEPDIRMIAARVKLKPDDAQILYTLSRHVKINIDEYSDDCGGNDGLISFDNQQYDDLFVLIDYMKIIYDIIEALPMLEGVVILLRAGMYDTRSYCIREVGYVLEMVPGRVRDIEFSAIAHLRDKEVLAHFSHLKDMSPWDYICSRMDEKRFKDLTSMGIDPNIYSVDDSFGEYVMSGNYEHVTKAEGRTC
jgi:RNA polymerase primary sigma factor